jgi:hypothetical protein
MFAVRYVALAALVVLLSASVAATGFLGPDHSPPHGIGVVCGVVVLVALFVMKFVGPPPQAFAVRAALTAAIVAGSLYASQSARVSAAAANVNLALGLVLLGWYARE